MSNERKRQGTAQFVSEINNGMKAILLLQFILMNEKRMPSMEWLIERQGPVPKRGWNERNFGEVNG